MNFNIEKEVEYIIDKIYINGFEAFVVGGAVRDLLLGIKPDDYDITTSAKPDEIKTIFKDYKTIDTGIKHGTVGIIINKKIYEITTYRIEGEYKNNRSPESVEFSNDIKSDLKRRDFTINAMAYNKRIGLIDLFEGQKDLNDRVIKTVGNAEERFCEDALRMIRAVRFSAKLGFNIDNEIIKAIEIQKKLISNISIERITDEISKILLSDNPHIFMKLQELKVLDILKINICKEQLSISEKVILFKTPKDIVSRICMYNYITHDKSSSISNKLRYSKDIKNNIKTINNILFSLKDEMSLTDIKLLLKDVGYNNTLKYIEIIKVYSFYSIDLNNIEIINKYERYINQIISKNECYSIKSLNINGEDIKILGYQGKEIGEILKSLLNHVIYYPLDNEKKILIDLIKKS